MFKHIKNLIQKIKDKIDELQTIDIEDVLQSIDGGNLQKRAGYIITSCRENMSRREAAIALGISPKELKAIEKGLKAPNKVLVLKMAKLYRVPIKSIWQYAV